MQKKAEARPRKTARWGETLAALLLRFKGYRIEARNWRCPLGEIDIVAWDRGTLVFVEVKARSGTSAGPPEVAVDRRKQGRLVMLAQSYLARRLGELPPCRFDVIAIETRRPVPHLRHLRAAFRADDFM
jgi:putative endonuclease